MQTTKSSKCGRYDTRLGLTCGLSRMGFISDRYQLQQLLPHYRQVPGRIGRESDLFAFDANHGDRDQFPGGQFNSNRTVDWPGQRAPIGFMDVGIEIILG